MWHGKGKTAIVGIGYSELVRQSKRPLGLLALDACREAIADAGLSPQQIDGLATYPEAPFRAPALATASISSVSPGSSTIWRSRPTCDGTRRSRPA